jgi:hypothetical protein
MHKSIIGLIIIIALLPIAIYWVIVDWKDYKNAKDMENEEPDSIVRKLADQGMDKTLGLWVFWRAICFLFLLVAGAILATIDIFTKL